MGEFGSVDTYFAMIVGSLWVYEGPFSKKTLIFPRGFNDSIKLSGELWTTLGHFRVAFG